MIGTFSKIAVEFGGFDGKAMSNIWRFVVEDGWSGVFAEPNYERSRQIKINHPYDRVKAINQFITWEGDNSFDKMMEREGIPNNIDLLSIDVDGNEWHIWNAIKVYRPKVVVIEFNPTVPNDVYFVQDADPNINQGNSLLALIELGKQKRYSLICVGGMDAFFVLDEFYPVFKIPDNSIDVMFSAVQTLLFQGYDGSLFTAGLNSLAWKNVTFTSDQIQLLPKEERFFGDRQSPKVD
jgi:hypothetical protein